MYPSLFVRNDFIKTMGIKMLAGWDFERSLTSPGYKAIVNKSFCEKFGWQNPEDAIGQILDGTVEGKLTIIGVSEDFNYAPLRQAIGPMLMLRTEGVLVDYLTNYVIVRIKSENVAETLDFIRETYEMMVNESPFDYFFLDDSISKIYQGEEKFNKITTIFSVVAIFIGAIGLFGLATFSVGKKKKEISIRKVHGASTISLLRLLSKDFLILVLISGVMSIPLSWYLMNEWLNGFAYHVRVGYFGFLISTSVITFIAAVTIFHQVFKAASGNPIESLRSE
jgi:putative ABC transport system permease protein